MYPKSLDTDGLELRCKSKVVYSSVTVHKHEHLMWLFQFQKKWYVTKTDQKGS